jgi:hypothetical protein
MQPFGPQYSSSASQGPGVLVQNPSKHRGIMQSLIAGQSLSRQHCPHSPSQQRGSAPPHLGWYSQKPFALHTSREQGLSSSQSSTVLQSTVLPPPLPVVPAPLPAEPPLPPPRPALPPVPPFVLAPPSGLPPAPGSSLPPVAPLPAVGASEENSVPPQAAANALAQPSATA